MVSQQRQTSIVPDVPPNNGEDKQQHLEVTAWHIINLMPIDVKYCRDYQAVKSYRMF